MSHHGREYEDDGKVSYDQHWNTANKLGKAVELIKAIANGHGEDGHNGQFSTTPPRQACDKWLMDNGYPCEATRAAQKAKKLAETDEKIKRLEEERKEFDK